MRKTPGIVAVSVAAALSVHCQAPPEPAERAGSDIDRISRSVVRVVALQGGEEVASGSGTVINSSGLIYTNRHVVEDADDYAIEILEDANELPVFRYLGRLVGFSIDVDFAVLQIDRDTQGQRVLAREVDLPSPALRAEEGRRGDEVRVLGYPGIGDGYLSVTEGIVTTVRNVTLHGQRLQGWYQTDAEIAPGSSGGLAVNADGEMLGIPTAIRMDEEGTGGRLGLILTLDAVHAAIESGLETGVPRTVETPATRAIPGGELDFDKDPTYGSVTLFAGFEPDPHTIPDVISGGEVAVDYLGGDCVAYAAVEPDFRLNWGGSVPAGPPLSIVFIPEYVEHDATLLVSLPDGSWVCNDDANEDTFAPMVTLHDPAEGQYDIWVGNFGAAGEWALGERGTLFFTEQDFSAVGAGPGELDPMLDPYYGSVSLRAGFRPDPNISRIVGGGPVDATYLGGDCRGHAAQAPDVRLDWSGASDVLHVTFFADNGVHDATLVVKRPDGSWICNDDADETTLDPMVTLSQPAQGQYDIWVGSFERGLAISGDLVLMEDAEP